MMETMPATSSATFKAFSTASAMLSESFVGRSYRYR